MQGARSGCGCLLICFLWMARASVSWLGVQRRRCLGPWSGGSLVWFCLRSSTQKHTLGSRQPHPSTTPTGPLAQMVVVCLPFHGISDIHECPSADLLTHHHHHHHRHRHHYHNRHHHHHHHHHRHRLIVIMLITHSSPTSRFRRQKPLFSLSHGRYACPLLRSCTY